MNTHICDIVNLIVEKSPEFAVNEIEDMIALMIKTLIRNKANRIVEKYPEFGYDEVEEMVALVMKCLLAGVDAEKVIQEMFPGLRFHR